MVDGGLGDLFGLRDEDVATWAAIDDVHHGTRGDRVGGRVVNGAGEGGVAAVGRVGKGVEGQGGFTAFKVLRAKSYLLPIFFHCFSRLIVP